MKMGERNIGNIKRGGKETSLASLRFHCQPCGSFFVRRVVGLRLDFPRSEISSAKDALEDRVSERGGYGLRHEKAACAVQHGVSAGGQAAVIGFSRLTHIWLNRRFFRAGSFIEQFG